jgi:hypothetical protein
MMPADPEPAPAGSPSEDPGEGQEPPADGDGVSPTDPGPGGETPGDDDDYAQTATVINNFFAEVGAGTIGVAGAGASFATTSSQIPSVRPGRFSPPSTWSP